MTAPNMDAVIGSGRVDGLAIASGNVPGVSSAMVFAYQSAVVSGSEHIVGDLGDDYTMPTVAAQVKVSSSSANDAAGGTGARTVMLHGLDADYNEITEMVTLNGQTDVTTAKSFMRVHYVCVQSDGSGGANAGDIYVGLGSVTAGVPDTKYAKIITGNNSTLASYRTVPAGRTAYLTQLWASTAKSGSSDLTAKFKVRNYGSVFRTDAKAVFYQNSLNIVPFAPVQIPAKSDIHVTAQATSDSPDFACMYQLIFVDN